MENAAVLRCVDVTKTYRSGTAMRDAVRDVSLSIETGSFVAIVGPSGSGKSTLLHLLGGLDTPTHGQVLLEGQRLAAMDDRARSEVRRRKIGFVFQAFNLVPVMSATENVTLPGVIAGLPPKACAERAAELLDLVGPAEMAGQRPAELSGGEQQRVALARALFMRPAVVLADEPTGNLDTTSARHVLSLLRQANDELGQTVVMVTHDADAAAMADRKVRLVDGMIVQRPTRRRPLAVARSGA